MPDYLRNIGYTVKPSRPAPVREQVPAQKPSQGPDPYIESIQRNEEDRGAWDVVRDSAAGLASTGAKLFTSIPDYALKAMGPTTPQRAVSQAFPLAASSTIPMLLGERDNNVFGLLQRKVDEFLDTYVATESGIRNRERFSERSNEAGIQARGDSTGVIGFAKQIKGEITQTISDIADSPADLAIPIIAEQIPNLLGVSAVGRKAGKEVFGRAIARGATEEVAKASAKKAATTAVIGSGAAMQGADVGGNAYDRVMSLPDEVVQATPLYQEALAKGFSDPQAKEYVAADVARKTGAAAAAISVITNKFLPTGEKALAGSAVGKSRLGRGLTTGAGEATQEFTEEAGGQLAANLFVGGVDPSQELAQGVGSAGALGAIAGGPLGVASGALSKPSAQGERPLPSSLAAREDSELLDAIQTIRGQQRQPEGTYLLEGPDAGIARELAADDTPIRAGGLNLTPTQLYQFAGNNTANPRIADIMAQPVSPTTKAREVARVLNAAEAARVEGEVVRQVSGLFGGTRSVSDSKRAINELLDSIGEEVVAESATLSAIRSGVGGDKKGKSFVTGLREIVDGYGSRLNNGQSLTARPARGGEGSVVMTQDQVADEAQREREAAQAFRLSQLRQERFDRATGTTRQREDLRAGAPEPESQFFLGENYGDLAGTPVEIVQAASPDTVRLQYESPTETDASGRPVTISEEVSIFDVAGRVVRGTNRMTQDLAANLRAPKAGVGTDMDPRRSVDRTRTRAISTTEEAGLPAIQPNLVNEGYRARPTTDVVPQSAQETPAQENISLPQGVESTPDQAPNQAQQSPAPPQGLSPPARALPAPNVPEREGGTPETQDQVENVPEREDVDEEIDIDNDPRMVELNERFDAAIERVQETENTREARKLAKALIKEGVIDEDAYIDIDEAIKDETDREFKHDTAMAAIEDAIETQRDNAVADLESEIYDEADAGNTRFSGRIENVSERENDNRQFSSRPAEGASDGRAKPSETPREGRRVERGTINSIGQTDREVVLRGDPNASPVEKQAPASDGDVGAAQKIIDDFVLKLKARGRSGSVAAKRFEQTMKDRRFSNAQVFAAAKGLEVTSRMLRGNYDIQLVDALFDENGKAVQGYFDATDTSTAGFVGLIKLSLSDQWTSMFTETSAHESFHGLQKLLALHDQKTYRLLMDAFKGPMTLDQIPSSIKRILQRTKFDEDGSYWDAMMDNPLFRDGGGLRTWSGVTGRDSVLELQSYVMGYLHDAIKSGAEIKTLANTFRKAMDFWIDVTAKVANGLRGRGLTSAKQVFIDAIEGRLAERLGNVGFDGAASELQYSDRDDGRSGFTRAVEGRRGDRPTMSPADVKITPQEAIAIKQAVNQFAGQNSGIDKNLTLQQAERALRNRKAQFPTSDGSLPNVGPNGEAGGFREMEVNGAKGIEIVMMSKPTAKISLEGLDENIASLVAAHRARQEAAYEARSKSAKEKGKTIKPYVEPDNEVTTPRELREAGVDEQWIKDNAVLFTFTFKKQNYQFAAPVDGEKLFDDQSTVGFRAALTDLPAPLKAAVTRARAGKLADAKQKRQDVQDSNARTGAKKSLPSLPKFEDAVTATEIRSAARDAGLEEMAAMFLTRPSVLTEKGREVVDQLADAIVSEIKDLEALAKKAEKNRAAGKDIAADEETAERIIDQRTWYSRMRQMLRRMFGSLGDAMADTLGATSARTPVLPNYKQTTEAMERWSRGEYDSTLETWAEFREEGGKQTAYRGPLALRTDNKKYNANTFSVMDALINRFRTKSAPKTPNYGMNLIGAIDDATIDVWAARFLDRIRNFVFGDAKWIPAPAEQAVRGTVKVGMFGRGTSGDFFFGQQVFAAVGKKLNMEPHEVQALVWFLEKDVWTQSGLTSAVGEGGDIASIAAEFPVNRILAGVAPDQQGDATAPVDMMKPVVEIARGLDSLRGLVNETAYGMYTAPNSRDVGYIENASNFEAILDAAAPQQDVNAIAAGIMKVARDQEQSDAFAAVTISSNDTNADHARPAMTVYFKEPMKFDAVKKFIGKVVTDNIGGFTAFADPQSGGDIRGLRFIFMPEYITEPEAVVAMSNEELQSRIDIMRRDALRDMEGLRKKFDRDARVGSAVIEYFDVLNGSKETYNEIIERLEGTQGRNLEGAEAATYQGPEGALWQQPISRSVRTRAERRIEAEGKASDRGGDAEGVSYSSQPVNIRDIRRKRRLEVGQRLNAPKFKDGPAVLGVDPIGEKYKFLSKQYERMVNRARPIKQLVKNIDDFYNDATNIDRAEQLMGSRAAYETKNFHLQELRPLLRELGMRGLTLKEVEDYLHNKHAKERNAVIRNRNKDFPDGGSGINDKDADAYLAAISPDKLKRLEAVEAKVRQITDKTLQVMLDSGDQSAQTIANLRETYKNWVPLFREGMEGGSPPPPRGGSVEGSSLSYAIGSSKPVENIIANVILQRENAIQRAESIRLGNTVLSAALENQDQNFWIVIDPSKSSLEDIRKQLAGMGMDPDLAEDVYKSPLVSRYNKRTGTVDTVANTNFKRLPNVFATRVDGTDKFVVFNPDQEMAVKIASVLRSDDLPKGDGALGAFVNLVGPFTRMWSQLRTQYMPEFGPVNFTRDVWGSLVNLTTTPINGQQLKVIRGAIKYAAHLTPVTFARERGNPVPQGSRELADLFDRFERAGGRTAIRNSFFTKFERKPEDLEKELNKAVKELRAGKTKAPKIVVDAVTAWNDALENATRLSAFKVAIDEGLSDAQAAEIAKNLTVNFNQRGQWTNEINSLYGFSNASIASTDRNMKTMLSPVGKKIFVGGVGLGVIQGILLAAAGYDEDDVPEWVKDHAFIIPIFGTDKYVPIPMPYFYNIFPAIGRRMVEVARGQLGLGDFVMGTGKVIINSVNPIAYGAGLIEFLSPSIIDPFVQWWQNEDGLGRRIYNPNFSDLSPTTGMSRARGDQTVMYAMYSAVAETLNTLSGGDEYTAGSASPTPEEVRFFVEQAIPPVSFLYRSLGTVEKGLMGGEIEVNDMPFIRRFLGETNSNTAEGTRFYDNVKEINILRTTIMDREEAGVDTSEIYDTNPLAALTEDVGSYYRDVSDLRRERREMVLGGADRAEVAAMEDDITALMKEFNDIVREAKESEE